jgi:predicted transcriptional regulator
LRQLLSCAPARLDFEFPKVLKITQEELAEHAEMKQSNISRFENGEYKP